jgi:NADH:ubiquinone oxidoreductase subunit C
MKLIDRLQKHFPGTLMLTAAVNGRLYITVDPADIRAIATFLYRNGDARFIIATGTDLPEGIEILYHFADDRDGSVYSLRVLLADKQAPTIDSLSSLLRGAHWIEREIHELLGVTFTGHPNLKHLLLADDWPAGSYPLRHQS